MGVNSFNAFSEQTLIKTAVLCNLHMTENTIRYSLLSQDLIFLVHVVVMMVHLILHCCLYFYCLVDY